MAPSDYHDDAEDLEDPFESEQESDANRYYRLMGSVSKFREITAIAKFFLILTAIAINLYLIVTICRNKNLRKIKANRYIMHYAIFDISLFVSFPVLMISIQLFYTYGFFSWWSFCIESQLETSSAVCMFLCTFGLALDWLLTVFCTNVKPMVQKIYNYSICIIYLLGLAQIIMDNVFCYSRHPVVMTIVGNVGYLLLLIFVVFCNVKSKSITSKVSYSLIVATIMVSCWLPLYVYHNLRQWFYFNYTLRFIIEVTMFIPEYIAFGSPIIVLILLGKINKYFCIAYRKSCSCCICCKAITNYTGDDESFERSDSIEHIENIDTIAHDATLL